MMPMGYHRIVKELRDPYFQCIDPWRRRVVYEAADAIERLLDFIDNMIQDMEEEET